MRFRGAPPPRVRVWCDQCGPVTVTFPEVTVRYCTSNGRGQYRFRCPDCSMTCVVDVHPYTLRDLLLFTGPEQSYPLRFEEWSLPAELDERPPGPPFTNVDIILWQRELEQL